MEAEAVLNLFDTIWFHLGILENPPKTSISSTLEPSSNHQIQQNPSNQNVSRQTSLLARSKSDELSCLTTRVYSSPDSVLNPHLRTKLSDKEISSKPPKVKVPVRRYDRRKKQLSKSLSELEFDEVKGFADIGFVFSEEDKNSTLVEIIPGLQKLGQITESCDREDKRRVEEASRMRARPYLSEAWEFYEAEEKALMKWRVPLPPAAGNEMDMKDSLKSWAHTVASAVR